MTSAAAAGIIDRKPPVKKKVMPQLYPALIDCLFFIMLGIANY
jgi:hypothetical protein